jgi:thioredoxin-related protein
MRPNLNLRVLYFFVIFSVFILQSVLAQAPRREPEKKQEFVWYKYDEGLKKAQEEKKNIMINFYTKLCGFCRKMDRYTFADEEVKKILLESYVPIKVDGGSKAKLTLGTQTITERDLTLKYKVFAFPNTLFLKPTGEKIPWVYNPIRGYLGADIFLDVLNYLKDDLYKKTTFKEYLEGKDQDKKGKK